MSASEYAGWLDYHNAYDLPDAFLVTERIGRAIVEALGGKPKPGDFAPYFCDMRGRGREADQGPAGPNESILAGIAFVRSVKGEKTRKPPAPGANGRGP